MTKITYVFTNENAYILCLQGAAFHHFDFREVPIPHTTETVLSWQNCVLPFRDDNINQNLDKKIDKSIRQFQMRQTENFEGNAQMWQHNQIEKRGSFGVCSAYFDLVLSSQFSWLRMQLVRCIFYYWPLFTFPKCHEWYIEKVKTTTKNQRINNRPKYTLW